MFRFFITLLLLQLLTSPLSASQSDQDRSTESSEVTASETEEIADEDLELIADLELLELYELLQNLNALASMEDTQ